LISLSKSEVKINQSGDVQLSGSLFVRAAIHIQTIIYDEMDGVISNPMITIRNTSQRVVILESISIKKNINDEPWYTNDSINGHTMTVGTEYTTPWNLTNVPSNWLSKNITYLIKVTTISGNISETSITL
jgi:hypothetical protein